MRPTVRVVRRTLPIWLLLALLTAPVFAADGGGTNTVSPNVAAQSATGQTFTYTYTADATKSSGGMTVNVPNGWTAPQGASGTSGYTTAASTGTIGDELD